MIQPAELVHHLRQVVRLLVLVARVAVAVAGNSVILVVRMSLAEVVPSVLGHLRQVILVN